MGACVSTPRGCVGGRSSSSKKKKKKSFKRVASRLPTDGSLDKVDRPPPVDRHSSFTNPALQGHLFLSFSFYVYWFSNESSSTPHHPTPPIPPFGFEMWLCSCIVWLICLVGVGDSLVFAYLFIYLFLCASFRFGFWVVEVLWKYNLVA